MKKIKLPDGTEIEDRRKKTRILPTWFCRRIYKKHGEAIEKYKKRMIRIFRED